MAIVNRRNAVLGWAVWKCGQRFAKRKARQVVLASRVEARRQLKPAILSGLAALGGVLLLWSYRRQKPL